MSEEINGNFLLEKEWFDEKPPIIKRKLVSFGVSEISDIDWVDCV